MKKVIVTGAGQGIGLEVVIQLCKEGYFVIWNEIDPSVFKTAAQHLEKHLLTNQLGILGDSSSQLFLNDLKTRLLIHPELYMGVFVIVELQHLVVFLITPGNPWIHC